MNNEKTKSVLAYLFGIIGGLIVLLMKDSEKRTKICAAQSVTLFIVCYILRLACGLIPVEGVNLKSILNIVYFAAVIIGIVKACGEGEPDIPIIGDLAKSIFKSQIEK